MDIWVIKRLPKRFQTRVRCLNERWYSADGKREAFFIKVFLSERDEQGPFVDYLALLVVEL